MHTGGSRMRRSLRLGSSLLLALGTAACTSATLPKLTDLIGPPQSQAAPEAQGVSAAPLPDAAPPAGVTGTGPRLPKTVAGSAPPRPSNGPPTIVGFKGPTIVLFGEEFGSEGERIAASSLSLPLQARDAASNASRVQIETAYGSRWIARSEIVLGALERPRTSQPIQ